jgi:hypothetical protein
MVHQTFIIFYIITISTCFFTLMFELLILEYHFLFFSITYLKKYFSFLHDAALKPALSRSWSLDSQLVFVRIFDCMQIWLLSWVLTHFKVDAFLLEPIVYKQVLSLKFVWNFKQSKYIIFQLTVCVWVKYLADKVEIINLWFYGDIVVL